MKGYLGCEEGLGLEQVEVVLINKIREELTSKTVQIGHLRQRQVPAGVARAIHIGGTHQGAMVIKPFEDLK